MGNKPEKPNPPIRQLLAATNINFNNLNFCQSFIQAQIQKLYEQDCLFSQYIHAAEIKQHFQQINFTVWKYLIVYFKWIGAIFFFQIFFFVSLSHFLNLTIKIKTTFFSENLTYNIGIFGFGTCLIILSYIFKAVYFRRIKRFLHRLNNQIYKDRNFEIVLGDGNYLYLRRYIRIKKKIESNEQYDKQCYELQKYKNRQIKQYYNTQLNLFEYKLCQKPQIKIRNLKNQYDILSDYINPNELFEQITKIYTNSNKYKIIFHRIIIVVLFGINVAILFFVTYFFEVQQYQFLISLGFGLFLLWIYLLLKIFISQKWKYICFINNFIDCMNTRKYWKLKCELSLNQQQQLILQSYDIKHREEIHLIQQQIYKYELERRQFERQGIVTKKTKRQSLGVINFDNYSDYTKMTI